MAVLFSGLPFLGHTQVPENLVLNPSFEENYNCMAGVNAIDDLVYWYNLFESGSPGYLSGCTSDPYGTTPNNLFGFQYARTGNSYGFQTNFLLNSNKEYANPPWVFPRIRKEPFSGKLNTPLVVDEIYYFEFYVSKCQSIPAFIATDAFDLLFTADSTTYSYPYSPFVTEEDIYWSNPSGNIIEDTVNWVKLSGCFTAKGGEEFFTVGAFRDTALINNTFYSDGEISYSASYFYDDFLIYQCDTCCPDQYPIEDYITVNNNLITQGEPVFFETFLNEGHTANLYLFDSAGRIVYSAKLNGTDNSHQIPNNLAAGVYHYAMVTSEKKKLGGKIVVIN